MRRLGISLGSLLLVLAIGGASAWGNLAVYSNPFTTRAAVADLKKVEGGGECASAWVRSGRDLALDISKGEVRCVFSTPVRGDAAQPAHALAVEATISKGPPKSVRDDLAIVLRVRGGVKSGYELRVVPGMRGWELVREPGGAGFPQQGSSQAIAGLGKPNEIVLQAFGDQVTATVNGVVLVNAFVDPAPGQVEGRTTSLGFVTQDSVKDDVAAAFDDLRVMIPDP
jgi:hypothetical protein